MVDRWASVNSTRSPTRFFPGSRFQGDTSVSFHFQLTLAKETSKRLGVGRRSVASAERPGEASAPDGNGSEQMRRGRGVVTGGSWRPASAFVLSGPRGSSRQKRFVRGRDSG